MMLKEDIYKSNMVLNILNSSASLLHYCQALVPSPVHLDPNLNSSPKSKSKTNWDCGDNEMKLVLILS